jgi:hypothetical protein
MGGGCRIISINCIAQSAKECQEGKANGHYKEGIVARRPERVGGGTVALDQGWGIEILMREKVVVQIGVKFVAKIVRFSCQSFFKN